MIPRRQSRSAIFHNVVALALGVALVAGSGCGEKPATPRTANPVLTAELAAPLREAWPDTLIASGEVAAWQEASIGAELTGVRLEQVLVNVGDKVKKGQLLAQFSEATLRADLAALDAAVAEAAANLAKAQADAARADKLEATGALSPQLIMSYRTQAQAAEARLASARAQRDAQQLRLRHARVTAPDDGVISSRSATVGAVSAMGVELFRLVRRNRLEWRAEVPAEALSRLKPGVSATIKTLGGAEVTGTLRQLAPTVDPGTRNGLAYVDLPADNGLAAGMYVSGHFVLETREALVVPESAIVQRDGNRYLMRVDGGNRVHEIKVATGRRRGDAIEILGDIAESDRFVKSGGAFVSNGDLIRVVNGGQTTP